MPTPAIIIDDIIQVFKSHGNLHLIFGSSTGEVLPDGKDIINPAIHLVIPESRTNHISGLLKIALHLNESTQDEKITPIEPESSEKIGIRLFLIK